MAAALGDDNFDQLDKPGSERSRRRKTSDDDSGSDLDDLLEEDLLSGNKNQSDYSDEDLNDDLLQSDEEEQEQQQSFSSEVVTVSLNATSGMTASFELSKSTNDQSLAPDSELDEGEDEVVYEESEEPEEYVEEYTEGHYEGTDAAELTEELMEYAEEQEEEEIDTDEALVLEINEPLDEFPDDELAQTYTGRQEYVIEEELAEDVNSQTTVADSEELVLHTSKTKEEKRDESDEEEEDDERSGRIRFITERKEGTIIRLSEAARERRNIPETLELSVEDKAALMEFEEQQRHRKHNRFGGKRGGHARRGGAAQFRAIGGDQRKDNNESGRGRDNRPPLLATQPSVAQPIRSLFQQHAIQPLLPMPRPRHSSPLQPKTESSRVNKTNSTSSQPKNIHINPHFKGSVATPVQVPLLPTPPQPRPAAIPQRFPGPPDFPPHAPPHITGNLNQGPRLPPPEHWRSPPPVQERDQFFIGDPRFPSHHVFDQRSPPPPHPPPLLNSNHPIPAPGPLSFNQSGPGFNPQGQQSGFNIQSQQATFSPQGQPPGYNLQGQQSSYNQHGQPPRFSHQGQPPVFNQQGHQSGFSQPGQQPGFNQQGQQLGFAQGQQSGFNQIQPPGFNPMGQPCGFTQQGQQSGVNQHGQQSGYNQHGPQSEFNQQGQHSGYSQHGPQSGFPRDRTVRPSIQSPGGPLLHYNQPAAGSTRPFVAPRQQFPPSPGQPFISHAQSNMQGLLHHPPPPTPPHHHHHLAGPPQPLLPVSLSPFRPHIQAAQQQQNTNRMQFPQRQGHIKPRHSTPTQNAGKRHQLSSLPRNSNLRELPIAPSQTAETTISRRGSVPAAQVKPISHGASAFGKTVIGVKKLQGKVAKHVLPAEHPKTQAKPEVKLTDEDEETKLYRLKIEEQKRLREEILKQKELRRQQQAGARKKELLERLAQQHSPAPQLLSQQETQAPHMPVNCNSSVPQTTAPVQQNVKNRLLVQKQAALGTVVQQKSTHFQQGAGNNIQFQGLQRNAVKQIRTNRLAPQNPVQPVQKLVQAQPPLTAAVTTPAQTPKVALVQGRSQELKTGVKRTVMQRANSGSGDGPHIAAKVRVIKLSGAGGENAGFTYLESQTQRVQQFQQPQQQRMQPLRKVTLTKATVQHQTQIQSAVPQGVRSIHGIHQPKQVIMRGRGRGTSSQMGRGRMMPNTKNLRVVECKPQPCTVSVEGLSSSTTDFQLQSLLMSVGPIESFQMLPEQRKAIAKFTKPQHASSFQQKFHRHMIDLSHINVLLLAE
ncbi:RNA-binding protein 33 isoform X1 [Pleurodeles waltl]|uniref:RNA-binding protein 33 isoform X1 n=1 Tax=Pleurodeles waltl TaxID=8319 RepID=UPI003709C06E